MCKKSIAVKIREEAGRISDIRRIPKKGGDQIICTFISRGCTDSRKVSLKEVEPANKKAAKKLLRELEKISIRSRAKSSLY
jgi:hypothetical protein